MAMYRLYLPVISKRPSHSHLHHSQGLQLQPVRIGAIKRLHKPAMGGVIAAEFLPCYKSRVVSIGHDGRCRLVDFEGGSKVLRT
jgi:hypothetical protein